MAEPSPERIFNGWYMPYCPLVTNNKPLLSDTWLRPDRNDAVFLYLGPEDKKWYTLDEYNALYDDCGRLKPRNCP